MLALRVPIWRKIVQRASPYCVLLTHMKTLVVENGRLSNTAKSPGVRSLVQRKSAAATADARVCKQGR